MVNRKTTYYRIKLPIKDITTVSSLLEGIEGLGFSRTIDENKGILEIISPQDQEKYLELFLEDLKNWVKYKIIYKRIAI